MNNHNYRTSFAVDQSPEEVFDAINNVRGWWSENLEGETDKLGEFKHAYKDVHCCTIKITELAPGKKVVWHVVDNYFNFVKDKNEWIGTDVVFEIAKKGNQTEVHFTHIGLVPTYECYGVCSDAWGSYITGSLCDLITTGKGHPNPKEEIVRNARQMAADKKDESKNVGWPVAGGSNTSALPAVVDRATFQAELDGLRVREKAHTREGDAIASARRRLPMVEVDANLALIGPHGPITLLEAFEGRRQLIAYYFMWKPGRPAAEQCEGCTWVNTQVVELSYLHSRDITYAVFCQGPYDESVRYRDFMDWHMPWYSAQESVDQLLVGRQIGLFHLVCYVRDGDRVFETYWTTRRGAEAMDYSYALMDLTVYGRQEPWEDSPPGWPQQCSITRTKGGSPTWPPVSAWPRRPVAQLSRLEAGRPIAQWPRLEAGRSDDLGTRATATAVSPCCCQNQS